MSNYFEILDKILKNIDNINITESLKDKFIERTKNHVNLVNKYAAKLGMTFPNHDSSKFGDLLEPYSLFMKQDRTKEEDELLDLATLIHIKNSPHHPEYWTDTNLEGFSRKNPNPNGIIDATEMDENSMTEMLCDWCSMSEEKDNTPMEWFNKVNGTRWLFTTEQQRFIRETIKKLWTNKPS